MSNKHEAYYLLLEISDEIRDLSTEREIYQERLTIKGYSRKKTGHSTAIVKNLDFASLTLTALSDLSKSARLFVVDSIMPQVCLYNLLWHRDPSRKSQEKLIIRELVDQRFIFRTEAIGIYLLNPLKIWRGNPITAVEATKDLLREHRRPSKELIRDLRPGEKYDRTSEENYNSVSNNGLTPNLLEESQPGYSAE